VWRSRAELKRFSALSKRFKVAETLSDEFEQELSVIRERYSDEDLFESFDIRAYGHDELNALLRARDRRAKSIDADLKIRYDVNKPSVISYRADELRGFVCTVPAQEIARLVNEDTHGSVFDLNLRKFLGGRGAVNKDIMETCTSRGSAHEFWFLNNGITIVCDSFDPNPDADDPRVKLKNLQIVNGCQTATTLARAQKDGTLRPEVRVMARIYETPKGGLVDKIVLTTNNQNRISSRDLRANDIVQVDMERAFAIYGLLYERKQRQHDTAGEDPKKIVPNEAVGQWYLAVVMKNPADGRGRKYKIWGEFYDKIFAGKQPIEPYVVAVLLGRRVTEWINASGYKKDTDDLRRVLAKRGAFHVGRIAAFLWKSDDRWDEPQDVLADRIATLTADSGSLDATIADAFALLEKIVSDDFDLAVDLDRALKSYVLDEKISKTLHLRKAQKVSPKA
jgi:AIPR protein